MPYQGHLDDIRGRDCIGWSYDPARPGFRVRVHVLMDGVLLRTRLANSHRPDLLAAGIGDGSHAFSVELPDTMFDGQTHTISAVEAESGETILSYVFRSVYSGAIEDVSQKAVRIRLLDESRPAFAVEAELWADGRFAAAGTGPELRLPSGFDIRRVTTFQLRARGCDVPVADWITPAEPVLQAIPQVPDDVVAVLIHPAPQDVISTLRTLESLASAGNEVASEVHVILGGIAGHVLPAALEDARERLGFHMHAGAPALLGDKVYLEPGALVASGWLDRLRNAAYADARIATASPLTGGPVDGHSARAIDNLCRRLQPGGIAGIDAPSSLCSYHRQRDAGQTMHVLAGGVRVEAIAPVWAPEDRDHAAHKLRRTIEEQFITPPLNVTASEGNIVTGNGLRYRLPEDSGALASLSTEPIKLVDAVTEAGIPYEVEVHDYGWICPRGDLIDETGRYCGEPSIEACERCFRKLGPRDGWGMLLHRCGSVAELREQNRRVLEGALLVRFPSRDAADRIGRYAKPRKSTIAAADSAGIFAKPILKAGERLRIALAGNETRIWSQCILDADKRELPLEFGSQNAHVAFLADEAPPLRAPGFSLYPVRFDIGADGPGLRIPCGLPASRINDTLMREFFA